MSLDNFKKYPKKNIIIESNNKQINSFLRLRLKQCLITNK